MSKISIVIPVYKSKNFLHKTVEAVDDVFVKSDLKWKEVELVLVDDGSNDGSYEKIEELEKSYPYIKGVKLSRNFGHQIAVRTGLGFATGDMIAIIDDDLQDPPSLLPRFFEELEKGYDVVYGVRRKRKESFFKKLSYKLFYIIFDKLSDTKIPLDSGDFCVMSKRVKEHMLTFQEQSPYLRGIRAWVGFKQKGLEYERSARIEGDSGYTLKKLIKIAKDGIYSFSSLPLRLISILGNIGLSISVLFSIYILIKFFITGIEIKGYTSLILMILFFNSVLLICLGVIGEYIYRIYNEVRARPHMIIEQTINC